MGVGFEGKAAHYGREKVQEVIDEINEVIGDDKQIHRGSGEFLVYGDGMLSGAPILDEVSRQFGSGNNDNSRKNQRRYSIQVDDSTGKKITPRQQKFFKNSKAVDENGRLKRFYHGTGVLDLQYLKHHYQTMERVCYVRMTKA